MRFQVAPVVGTATWIFGTPLPRPLYLGSFALIQRGAPGDAMIHGALRDQPRPIPLRQMNQR